MFPLVNYIRAYERFEQSQESMHSPIPSQGIKMFTITLCAMVCKWHVLGIDPLFYAGDIHDIILKSLLLTVYTSLTVDPSE